MELHVWGSNSISIISPESRAAAWLLQLHHHDFTIVTSSNTNLSDTHVLPLLIANNTKYEGFEAIATFVDPSPSLVNASLLSYINSKITFINQYNLYINTENYEKHTRKLFQHYFPFPMMYNQPLKFYHTAQQQVRIIGLNQNKVGFFSVSGNYLEDVAQTEYANDSDDESDLVAMSALHEKQLVSRTKKMALAKELKNSLKCLTLTGEYIGTVCNLYKELNPESGETYGLLSREVSSSELLLFAYISSLTSEDLPNRFIARYIEQKFPGFNEFVSGKITELNALLESVTLRTPVGDEVPSLYNEIKRHFST